MNQKQVQKRYYKEFVIAMGAYVIVLITSITMLQRVELSSPLRIITALSPAIPVAFVIIAIMRAMRNSDELQRRVQFNAIMFSAVLTGFITFSYGFLENIGFSKFFAQKGTGLKPTWQKSSLFQGKPSTPWKPGNTTPACHWHLPLFQLKIEEIFFPE